MTVAELAAILDECDPEWEVRLEYTVGDVDYADPVGDIQTSEGDRAVYIHTA